MSRYPNATTYPNTHHGACLPRRRERGSGENIYRCRAGGTASLLATLPWDVYMRLLLMGA
jgi:hypothetical protein